MNMCRFAFLGILISNPLWSFPCYYTLVKDNCWTDYTVSVDVTDASTLKTLFTVTAPAGTPWARQEFTCTPAQGLLYVAKFSPVFWKSDEGKTYQAIRNWNLPAQINPGDIAWTIPVCFPADFSQVPFPPNAGGNCKCDLTSIPAPKPE